MTNRRSFLKQLGAGTGYVVAAGVASSGRVLGANERIRIGLIGAGGRGKEIFRAALRCPGVEAVAVADVYTRRLEEAKALAPGVRTYRDFRRLLDDPSIHAVLIATPQHQHALNFVPALQAGKDVYQEKTMAFTPDHARRMHKAFAGSGRVVQIGMQMNSGPGLEKVQALVGPARMGTLSTLETFHYRNAPYGGWLRPIPADCDVAHVDWAAFEGEAAHHDFDPQRYLNWRFYWDYSGGNVFENMVHQVGFWYGALGLGIPASVTMAGANYRSPKMEVPDAMTVVMNQPEQLLFTWSASFGNAYFGEGRDYLFGTQGTVLHDESDRGEYWPQHQRAGGSAPPSAPTQAGYADFTLPHMRNFFDCVRSRQEPRCPFDLGFRTAIACQMAIASYRQGRTVRWDAEAQTIV